MNKKLFRAFSLIMILALALMALPMQTANAAGTVSLTTLGSAYTQDFNTLASSGTSSTVPNGWDFSESGTNANAIYTAGTGSSNAGDTYSFGAASNAERAFGGLQSGSLVPIIGASFTNNTGSNITNLAVSYTGEQWRLGATGRTDRIDFQYSLDATSLTTGTWSDVDSLDFTAPITGPTIGALDGNSPPNRVLVSFTITGLGIADGSTFWIRWTDFNAAGADDGLSVDDFSLTPDFVPTPPRINEFVFNHTGTDTNEYAEAFGIPMNDYSAYQLLQIEGDGTGAGLVDSIHTIGVTNAEGYWFTGFLNNVFENGTVTLLLVKDFSGSLGTDLDTNNDGIFDSTPWTSIVDDVAVSDGGSGDRTYSGTILAPGFGGNIFTPGGASRIPDGTDTNSIADWMMNDFDGAGIPGFPGTPVFGEAYNTPGSVNEPVLPKLVINEIDYDQPGTDTAEFIEIRNNDSAALSLSGWTLELVNGNAGGAVIYDTIALPNVNLLGGDYFVVCANAATVPNCDLDDDPDTNFIQNGDPDAVGLRFNGILIDAVSYEGNSGAPYTEGSGAGLVDTAAGTESISRCPDGSDTNVNNADFLTRPSTPGEANDCPPPPPALGVCGDPATFIHAVQGSGLASPLVGTTKVIEGVVVGDFQNNLQPDNGDLNGFYVQEEESDADADPTTSEGIFVFAPSAADVSVGNKVRVLGDVIEFSSSGVSMTELTNIGGLLVCELTISLPAPASVTLPVTSIGDFERYEGMLVTLPQALAISEFFNFDRFNEVVLTLGRQFQPTAVFEPGSVNAANLALANSLSRITLDDGRSSQNPDPAIHPNGSVFDLTNRFRGGDTVQNATGVIDHTFGLYRIHPTAGAQYVVTNPRPTAPDDVGGSLQISSFNVLNYFTTLTSAGSVCGPSGTLDCRGADTAQEFQRQRTKIIAALSVIDADVVGLIEIENHPGDIPTADLVSGLNDAMGAGTYDYIATGGIGTDAIRVALIYKPGTVTPVGSFAILNSSVDPRFVDTLNRPVLAQTFEENATGARFTVAVNHLKSKGSSCGGSPDDDPQQGNCNGTRTRAAQALVDWLATDPTGSGDPDFLIMGDLNAYDKEDPIDAIQAGSDDILGTDDDYTDLIFEHQGEFAYSFLFDGQLGYLDHALATKNLVDQVTGATEWHINADEPDILDYDMTFKQDAQDALFEPNAFRSSDHDPVVVGLKLHYLFTGFFPPINNQPVLNIVKAGQGIPIKFSLNGDQGLGIFAADYPKSEVIACDASSPTTGVDETVTAGSSSLSYDPVTDTYTYVWKTSKAWANTCRQLVVKLDDGTFHRANFSFTK